MAGLAVAAGGTAPAATGAWTFAGFLGWAAWAGAWAPWAARFLLFLAGLPAALGAGCAGGVAVIPGAGFCCAVGEGAWAALAGVWGVRAGVWAAARVGPCAAWTGACAALFLLFLAGLLAALGAGCAGGVAVIVGAGFPCAIVEGVGVALPVSGMDASSRPVTIKTRAPLNIFYSRIIY